MKDKSISEPMEAAGAALPAHISPPRRILLVDDSVTTRWLNTTVLLRAGFEVDAAADGAAGWEALKIRSYDLLITDNSMPKVSGVELLRKLRDGQMSVPVIMATRAVPTEEFTRHPWLQPAATLLSPFTPEALLDTVKQVLAAAQCAREQIAPPPDWQDRQQEFPDNLQP